MFGEPEVNQYDNHMVMSGVIRPTKVQYIHVDTKYRDNQSASSANNGTCVATIAAPTASCNITLSQRITNVKSITVRNAEIPMTIYNISRSLGNNVFYAWHANNEKDVITLDDGEYTLATLKTQINAKIATSDLASHLSFDYNAVTNKTSFATTSRTVTLTFNVDANGEPVELMGKLGWMLGFRQPSYSMGTQSSIASEGVAQLQPLKYLYLVLDEFSRGNARSFIANPDIRKQILAKIVVNKSVYPFGTVLPANTFNGYLLSDTRQYQGEIDLLRMKVELVDDLGRVVDLNGGDFSFTLEAVTH